MTFYPNLVFRCRPPDILKTVKHPVVVNSHLTGHLFGNKAVGSICPCHPEAPEAKPVTLHWHPGPNCLSGTIFGTEVTHRVVVVSRTDLEGKYVPTFQQNIQLLCDNMKSHMYLWIHVLTRKMVPCSLSLKKVEGLPKNHHERDF